MPITTKSVGKGRVQVRTPNGIKAKSTTPAKAKRQARLLNAVDHGWKPTGSPGRDEIAKRVAGSN
jgi:hypothetical protein